MTERLDPRSCPQPSSLPGAWERSVRKTHGCRAGAAQAAEGGWAPTERHPPWVREDIVTGMRMCVTLTIRKFCGGPLTIVSNTELPLRDVSRWAVSRAVWDNPPTCGGVCIVLGSP